MKRRVHPLAWWGWAFGIAIASYRAPGLAESVALALAIIAVTMILRDNSTFAKAFRMYLVLAVSVVVIRVIFHVLVGIKPAGTVILSLPKIPLPSWAAGIQLLGPVTLEGLVGAITAGAYLAVLLLCFGAAVALTNPRRTLRNLPSALYLVGTSSVIATTFAPQLVESWQRVRRAQSLRGRQLGRWQSVKATLAPVLQDALERSVTLAAAMDCRGYARLRAGSAPLIASLLLVSVGVAAVASFLLLTSSTGQLLALGLLALAVVLAVSGVILASRSSKVTRFDPERWGVTEWLILGSGLGAAAIAILVTWLPKPDPIATLIGFVVSALVASAPILFVQHPESARKLQPARQR